MIADRTKHLENQSINLKVIADYFTEEAAAKRQTKKAKAWGLLISALIFIATIFLQNMTRLLKNPCSVLFHLAED